jgi:CHAT domain-containing protein
MACLLACSTARNEDEQLFDEMLHIVSGFQVAGFPHVIGALWAVDDDIASDIAGAFAERISQSDGSDTAIAKALHDAVNTVRLKGGILNRDVLGWAQFVHFGC